MTRMLRRNASRPGRRPWAPRPGARWPRGALALGLLGAWLAAQSAGCASPAYYAQAMAGHFELMRARQDIDALLAAGTTDPDLAARLRLAGEIRTFASSELGLPAGRSFGEVALTGREAVTWNVSAAPEFSLEPRTWCFPVAGCVAYRGYFAEPDAARFASGLQKKGYDVTIVPATAYSTLGWFDDPLTDTLLRYGDGQLAEILIHELAHQALYVKGDTDFSESFATFVGRKGARLWLESRDDQAGLYDWEKATRASRAFEGLLSDTRASLREIYGSDIDEPAMRRAKLEAIAELEARYGHMVAAEWGGRDYFRPWLERGINNASLAIAASYDGYQCAFENLFVAAGSSIKRFLILAQEPASLAAKARKEWLNQPCEPFASAPEL